MNKTENLPACVNLFSIRTIVFAGIISALLFVGHAQADENRSLIFAGNEDFPPLTYLENGTPTGMMIDVVHALEHRMGRPVDIRLMPWSRAVTLTQQDKIDAIGPMIISEERKKNFDFSIPINIPSFESQTVIFVRVDQLGISSLADLHGKRVGVTAGSRAAFILETEPNIQAVTSQRTLVEDFQLLKAGKLDAILTDSWVGSFTLAENNIGNIHITGKPVSVMRSAIAVKKGNTALLTEINAALESMQNDQTLANIYTKWLPKEMVIQTREQVARKTYFFVMAVLVLFLLAAAIWAFMMKREVKERIKSEQELVLNRLRLKKLYAHIEQIKEQQRKQLAREIHDELGGNLVSVKMVLHSMEHHQPLDRSWLINKFNYMDSLIDRTLEAAHRIVRELRPGILDLGIVPALEWQAKEFELQNNIPCKFISNRADIAIIPEHAIAIFRMVQEALTNIAKHANATETRVAIESTPDTIHITIEDNGVGMGSDHDKKQDSFGLLGMSERCNEIGATLLIKSEPGNGCRISISIPVHLSDSGIAQT